METFLIISYHFTRARGPKCCHLNDLNVQSPKKEHYIKFLNQIGSRVDFLNS